MDGEHVVRGVYAPLPRKFDQTLGTAEHGSLALAVLRREVFGPTVSPRPIVVDNQGLFAGLNPARALSGSNIFPFSGEKRVGA